MNIWTNLVYRKKSDVERKLFVSVISDSRERLKTITDLIIGSTDCVNITSSPDESSFLEKSAGHDVNLVISDRTSDVSGWKVFLQEINDSWSDVLVIFVLTDVEKDLTVEMIKAGVYDILSPASFNRIPSLINRIDNEIDNRRNLRYLKREKDFSDYISNSSRSMLSIVNRNYIYEKVNTTFCKAHNLAVNSIVGKSLAEVWGHSTFKSKIQKNVDLCFEGNTVRYESNFDTPTFGNRYYEVIFRPITRDSGVVSHLLAETFDITDLRLSKQVVNEMEEEFKKLETNLPIGFLRCEPDGTIIHANKAFLKIMDCDDDSLLTGLSINEFYAEKSLFGIHMQQLLNEKIKTFGRVPLYTSKGTEIACRISGFIVTNENGAPSFIDFAFEDSTRELLLENRLLQAQKLETIGALAGGLAHDFNNILATIFGYSELLLDETPQKSPTSEKVGKIINAVTKARSLTNQILTFSRQVEQEKIAVSVFEVLKETIGFIESGKPSNIEVKNKLENIEALVYADPTQLFRVFLNLMTNGIQAMEEKGGTLSIALKIVDGNLVRHELNRNIVADEYALVTVEDTGEGMDPSLTRRIFEPYFTTKEVGKGTGLGLSVVHGIIAEIEGEILVSSKKNKGSVFSVYLPVSKDYQDISGKTEKERRLLFISGNRYESRILSLALEKTGYKLDFATDLEAFSKLMSEEKIADLIIYMGDSENIKADDIISFSSRKKITSPIILITDNYQYLSQEKLLNSGIVKQILNKPVSLKEIRNAIKTSII
jgi:signal transduction histidine kinase/FixJ family two-component response regulator/CheY-like chemotaxis protein